MRVSTMAGAVAADRSERAACPIPAALAQGGNRPLAVWPPRSAYLHIPFCHRRCFYCDFPVVPLGDRASAEAGAPGSRSMEAYLEQLRAEIQGSAPGPPLSTVYIGGGTPSLLSAEQIQSLLQELEQRYGLAAGAEISLELDPASFDETRLQGYLRAGINRVSLGGQSFDDAVLERLGRRHRRRDLLEAARWLQRAQRSGQLQSWSLDLIQSLPGACLEHWRVQLQQAIDLAPPHLSIYDLIIEPGTVFARREASGELALPEDDLSADLLELTVQRLALAGYGHYEISNYALPGHASRHNRVYWSGAGWWGFGMGATAAPWGRRQARPRTREGYAQWVQASSEETAEQPSPMPFDERVMVGLRRREGVALAALAQTHGVSCEQFRLLEQRLEGFLRRGLLRRQGRRWSLSDPEGLALSNAVLRELLDWWSERPDCSEGLPPSL
ncbi:radical SAM family heme chaperone HemW [Vulcanococcus sp.]|uniref:radical SAM family heme chaperone HemW n=1 Tax=Vulcanococcus sp. TaxID=2856995 RepID=UPI003BFD2918